VNTEHSWAPIREFSAEKRRRRFPWEAGAAVVIVLGLLGWFLVPRYLEMKRASQEKLIRDHVFVYLGAADQFFRENPTRLFVRQDEMVGPSHPLRQAFASEAGEDYGALFPIRRDHPELAVKTADGRRVIWFIYDDAEGHPQRGLASIRANGDLDGSPEERTTYRQLLARQKHDGPLVKQFPDGSRFETTYRGGYPHGLFKATYPDGKTWGEANYDNGRVTGPCWNYPRSGLRFDEMIPADPGRTLKTVP
jgi:hypothetical protein